MFRHLVCLFVGCLLVVSSKADKQAKIHEDALLNVPQLLEKYGYPTEVHNVTTEDGYILEVHRIPARVTSDRPPVMLQHGLMTSSGDWVIMGKEIGLAYLLSDLGYDVWLGNSRGNLYSRRHVTFDPEEKGSPFWNYSFNEMGLYDVPAVVDHILEVTGKEKIFYVGHSQGTTQFFVSMSERPEYNDKIEAMFALAPVAYASHMTSPILKRAMELFTYQELESILGFQEFLPHSDAITSLGETFCHDGALFQSVCENILFILCGYDSAQLNDTMLPIIFGHAPAGTSTKPILHYAQLYSTGHFQRYDYGAEGNNEHYGSEAVPQFDLGNITCPVYLHYGLNDYLSSPVDLQQVHSELSNSAGMFQVPLPEFNHLDFLWAIDVKTLLYDLVIEQMEALVSSR